MSNNYSSGYALLIGVDDNYIKEWALPEVIKDVNALHDVLVHPQRCAYINSNVKLLTGDESSRQGILDGLEWLQNCVEKDPKDNATVIIYYSGHGMFIDSDYYLIPYDVREGQITSRGLRATDFADAVNSVKPKRLLAILDCCHAGGMGVKNLSRLKLSAFPRSLLINDQESKENIGGKNLHHLTMGSGCAVLSSSSGQQKSYIRRDGEMSIFTYHLIEALTGYAQTNLNIAEVLVSDVMGHVSRCVPQSAKSDWGTTAEQTPDFYVIGNFPIALLLGGQGLSEKVVAPNPLDLRPFNGFYNDTKTVSAGKDGVAVGENVLGDVLVNSIKVVILKENERANTEKVMRNYLSWIQNDCLRMNLTTIDPSIKRHQAPNITEIYVDINVLTDQKPKRLTNALEILPQHKFLVLKGVPGTGKSTFIRYIAFRLAEAANQKREGVKGWLVLPSDKVVIPIKIVLHELSSYLLKNHTRKVAGSIWSFLTSNFDDRALPPETVTILRKLEAECHLYFLFDGLDEAGNLSNRELVLETINSFIIDSHENSRFLITTRPFAWLNIPFSIKPESYDIAQLDLQQQHIFIDQWYKSATTMGLVNLGVAKEKVSSLKVAIARSDLQSLSTTPLLLTLMSTLHTRGRLPDDRVDLYEEIINLMLIKWNEVIGADRLLLDQMPGIKLIDIRRILQTIAFFVHDASAGSKQMAEFSEMYLIEYFAPMVKDLNNAREIVRYLDERAGLITKTDSSDKRRNFTFSHRTFQEFLAGCYLAEGNDLNQKAMELAKNNIDHWHEVLIIAARKAASRGLALVDELIYSENIEAYNGKIVRNDWRRSLLAAEQLLELGAAINSTGTAKATRHRVQSWLKALLMQDELPVQDRVKSGMLLGNLGDTRFDESNWYLAKDKYIGFVKISAGEFIFGNIGGEILKQKKISLDQYLISRYPITVDQFKAFTIDGQYTTYDQDSIKGIGNFPVNYVNVFDAMAYCNWLTEKLHHSRNAKFIRDFFKTDTWYVSLPNQLQWEKAARGVDGRVYSWKGKFDSDNANLNETGLRAQSPVGCFLNGKSPYGCLDMIGNIWEWTSSLADNLRDTDEKSEIFASANRNTPFIVKGGSCYDYNENATCSSFENRTAITRLDNLGFRAVICLGKS